MILKTLDLEKISSFSSRC